MAGETGLTLYQQTRKHRRDSRKVLAVATWNVRSLQSLVESTGDERICRKHLQGARAIHNTVERKLDLLVRELRRYQVSVAGIQETKWFGNDVHVWSAEGHIFLHLGQPLPGNSDDAARNESVGIVLDEKATAVWRAAGETWEAVNLRIVTARLKLASPQQRRHGGSRETSNTFVTVMSVYAPRHPLE